MVLYRFPLIALLVALVLANGSAIPSIGQEQAEKSQQRVTPAQTPHKGVQATLTIVGTPLKTPFDRDTIKDVLSYMDGGEPVWGPGEFHAWSFKFYPLALDSDQSTAGYFEFLYQGKASPAESAALVQRRLQQDMLELHQLRLEPLRHKLRLAEERVKRTEETINQVTQDLRRLRDEARQSGRALQPQDIQLLATVKRDNLALRAELAGLQAQREAIIEQIAKAKEKLDAAEKQQRGVLDELAQVVKLREDEVTRIQGLWKVGHATQGEVANAQVAVAQARADLLEHRRALVSQCGADQLARLNEQLIGTQIAMTTAEARLKETEKALQELEKSAYSPVDPLVLKYERTRRALESALTEHEAAAADLAKLKMALDATPMPNVVIRIAVEAKPK